MWSVSQVPLRSDRLQTHKSKASNLVASAGPQSSGASVHGAVFSRGQRPALLTARWTGRWPRRRHDRPFPTLSAVRGQSSASGMGPSIR